MKPGVRPRKMTPVGWPLMVTVTSPVGRESGSAEGDRIVDSADAGEVGDDEGAAVDRVVGRVDGAVRVGGDSVGVAVLENAGGGGRDLDLDGGGATGGRVDAHPVGARCGTVRGLAVDLAGVGEVERLGLVVEADDRIAQDEGPLA
jgi:hypothetical protein